MDANCQRGVVLKSNITDLILFRGTDNEKEGKETPLTPTIRSLPQIIASWVLVFLLLDYSRVGAKAFYSLSPPTHYQLVCVPSSIFPTILPSSLDTSLTKEIKKIKKSA